MPEIKTVIVDDEKNAREGLKTLLKKDSQLRLLKSCKDGLEAIEFLATESCDLLLLDIQMPAINGFEVLKSIPSPPFVIFITAYDQYAIKAFDHNAIDYLLKPFTNERFFQALEKAKTAISSRNLDISKVEQLMSYLEKHSADELVHTPVQDYSKLVIKTEGKIVLLKTANIQWVEAYDYYVRIHTADKTYLIKESLKNMETRLPAAQFLRVHKSAILNMEQIESLEHLQNAEYMVNLSGGSQVKVSRSYRQQLDKLLGIS